MTVLIGSSGALHYLPYTGQLMDEGQMAFREKGVPAACRLEISAGQFGETMGAEWSRLQPYADLQRRWSDMGRCRPETVPQCGKGWLRWKYLRQGGDLDVTRRLTSQAVVFVTWLQ